VESGRGEVGGGWWAVGDGGSDGGHISKYYTCMYIYVPRDVRAHRYACAYLYVLTIIHDFLAL